MTDEPILLSVSDDHEGNPTIWHHYSDGNLYAVISRTDIAGRQDAADAVWARLVAGVALTDPTPRGSMSVSNATVRPLRFDCPGCGRTAGHPCYEIADIGSPDGLTMYEAPFNLAPGQFHMARINTAHAAVAGARGARS